MEIAEARRRSTKSVKSMQSIREKLFIPLTEIVASSDADLIIVFGNYIENGCF